MCLRAGEGSAVGPESSDSDDSHHMMAAKVSFRFTGDQTFYNAVAGTVYPHNILPASVEFLQDTSKNIHQRGSQHRGAHRNPRLDGRPFDCVMLVWEYVSAFPPPAAGRLFPSITVQDITDVMQSAAVRPEVKLDPVRLTARCLRPGSATMVKNMRSQLMHQQDLIAIRDHGRWAGDVGAAIYAHSNPDTDRSITAPSLYDDGFMTIPYLQWFYMSPA